MKCDVINYENRALAARYTVQTLLLLCVNVCIERVFCKRHGDCNAEINEPSICQHFHWPVERRLTSEMTIIIIIIIFLSVAFRMIELPFPLSSFPACQIKSIINQINKKKKTQKKDVTVTSSLLTYVINITKLTFIHFHVHFSRLSYHRHWSTIFKWKKKKKKWKKVVTSVTCVRANWLFIPSLACYQTDVEKKRRKGRKATIGGGKHKSNSGVTRFSSFLSLLGGIRLQWTAPERRRTAHKCANSIPYVTSG